MKFLTPLLLVLCMLLATTALAGDPLDTNDQPVFAVATAGMQADVQYTQPARLERPTLVRDDSMTAAFTGDPIDGNEAPKMYVWVPNVGLIDLFWWLRK